MDLLYFEMLMSLGGLVTGLVIAIICGTLLWLMWKAVQVLRWGWRWMRGVV